jgi:hypothetical protein
MREKLLVSVVVALLSTLALVRFKNFAFLHLLNFDAIRRDTLVTRFIDF